MEIIKEIFKKNYSPEEKLILISLSTKINLDNFGLDELQKETSLPVNKLKKILKKSTFDFCRDWVNKVSKMKISDAKLFDNDCLNVLLYLNQKAKTHFRNTDSNLRFIKARMESGATYEEMCKVIDRQIEAWQGTAMEKYLRPETLFNATKFETYYNSIKSGVSCVENSVNVENLSDSEMSIYCD